MDYPPSATQRPRRYVTPDSEKTIPGRQHRGILALAIYVSHDAAHGIARPRYSLWAGAGLSPGDTKAGSQGVRLTQRVRTFREGRLSCVPAERNRELKTHGVPAQS